MSWSKIAGSGGIASGGSTSRTSFGVAGNAVGSGHVVRGTVTWGDATVGHLTSVTDNQGNSYSIVDKIADTAEPQSIASFWLNAITNAPTTITAHFSPGVTFVGIEWSEFSGNDSSTALTGHGGQVQRSPGTAADAVKTGTSFGSSGDLRSGGMTTDDTGSVVVTSGTGYTTDQNNTPGGSGQVSLASEYLVATGAADATFKVASNTPCITVGMSFSPASGGGSSGMKFRRTLSTLGARMGFRQNQAA